MERSILERGVDIINTKHDDDDEVDWMEEGYTALHYACHHRIENMVDLLLDKGADVEITESTGKKPLHIACQKGYIDIIEALLHNPFGVHVDINMKKVVKMVNPLEQLLYQKLFLIMDILEINLK